MKNKRIKKRANSNKKIVLFAVAELAFHFSLFSLSVFFFIGGYIKIGIAILILTMIVALLCGRKYYFDKKKSFFEKGIIGTFDYFGLFLVVFLLVVLLGFLFFF